MVGCLVFGFVFTLALNILRKREKLCFVVDAACPRSCPRQARGVTSRWAGSLGSHPLSCDLQPHRSGLLDLGEAGFSPQTRCPSCQGPGQSFFAEGEGGTLLLVAEQAERGLSRVPSRFVTGVAGPGDPVQLSVTTGPVRRLHPHTCFLSLRSP